MTSGVTVPHYTKAAWSGRWESNPHGFPLVFETSAYAIPPLPDKLIYRYEMCRPDFEDGLLYLRGQELYNLDILS